MRTNSDFPDGRGNDGFSDFLRRLRQRLVELQFYDSDSIAFEQTTRGVRAHVKNQPSDSSSNVQGFQLVSDGGDWYNCYTFDGVNVGTTIIKVAKTHYLLCILPTASPAGGAWASKTKRVITYTYTYNTVAATTDDGVNVIEYTRNVTGSDGSTALSYVAPCLNVEDIIYAIPASFQGPETLTGVQWLALADGRSWTDQET